MKKGLLFLTSLFITTTSFAQWTTNGNNVTIDKNIGIGTTNPQTKLDVDGNIFARQNILLGGNRQISTNLNDNLTYDGQSFGNYAFRWGADSWNTAEYSLWQSAWGGMKFFTHGQPRLAIHGNGNIGIGTTNPQALLDINGSLNSNSLVIGKRVHPTNGGSISRLTITPYRHAGVWDFSSRDVDSNAYLDINYSSNKLISIHHSKGIGILTQDPQYPLDVNGVINARDNIIMAHNKQISMNQNDNLTYDGQSFGNYAFRWGPDSWNTAEYSLWQSAWGGMKFFTHGEPRLAIHGNGNIGVGITNPQTKLDVNGVINARDNIIMAHNKQISMNLNDNFTYDNRSMGQYAMQWGLDSWKADGATLWQSAWGGMKFFVRGQPQLAIHNNGNIGIGTTNPRNKLDVNGTIRAREVKVEVENWSDFVFDKDYKLPSLQEVEAHINEHKHLPNIPSETQVKEEGINLSEMQAKLLQKIEELTLYVIELKKENESIKEQVNKLQNE